MAPASPHDDAAERLRHRAVALRALARRLNNLELHHLHRHAGVDTWMGPSQQRLELDLRTRRRALIGAAEALQAQARRFDREADQLAALPAVDGVR
ncbi:MAG: hypothetical protein RL238_439 [Actinomycetota bacterium]|jgi:hypothetical protein